MRWGIVSATRIYTSFDFQTGGLTWGSHCRMYMAAETTDSMRGHLPWKLQIRRWFACELSSRNVRVRGDSFSERNVGFVTALICTCPLCPGWSVSKTGTLPQHRISPQVEGSISVRTVKYSICSRSNTRKKAMLWVELNGLLIAFGVTWTSAVYACISGTGRITMKGSRHGGPNRIRSDRRGRGDRKLCFPSRCIQVHWEYDFIYFPPNINLVRSLQRQVNMIWTILMRK